MIQKLTSNACGACGSGFDEPIPLSMAFQPIVDIETGEAFAYEALVRGPHGEPADWVLSQVTPENRYAFDQNCRVQALTLAAHLGLVRSGARLSINFMPNAVYDQGASIQLTMKVAEQLNFSPDQIIFEIMESDEIIDRQHLRRTVEEYRRCGFLVAIDDFGAGNSGLSLLADFPADIIKIDMELTRNVPNRPAALAIVSSLVQLAKNLGSVIVAEGVESVEEYIALRRCGVRLMQGYLFGRPAFQALRGFMLPIIIEPIPEFPIPRPPHYLPIIFT